MFADLAVGAPYEGRGAVYIFRGSVRGLIADFSQRITASDLTLPSLSAFGGAVVGGADFDNNGYPDLVVGAYASASVVILRARPVVNIDAVLQAYPQMIDPKQTQCHLDNSTNICFQLNACFRFTAEPRDK